LHRKSKSTCATGEVALRGHVPKREMRSLAEDVAFNVPDVRHVNNDLRVVAPNR
jgi:osmotically-inducible protein OsmY